MGEVSYDLIPEEKLEDIIIFLKAISNRKRLEIIINLLNGERSVTELANMTRNACPVTCIYLNILRRNGTLKSRRNGQIVYYRIEDKRIRNIVTAIAKAL